jgi:pimeloyl-ACP methyl ester carboxylesterase
VDLVEIDPFEIRVDADVLDDLRDRIRRTRWPEPAPGPAWSQGTDLAYLQSLLAYWADGFDWPAKERELNRYRHFRANLDGVRIHFVHEKAVGGAGIPIILTHGWPSTFVELLPLVPLLTDPKSGPAFDVVIPSLPGYGFSERPHQTGVNYRTVAGLWHRLMRGLGYERYAAQGGDFGAGVASFMAIDDPGAVLGVHLTNLELAPPDADRLTDAERAYTEQQRRWSDVERGYSSIQSTKPQTVGYGLTDSPAGLAAWIMEKWRSWTDSEGDLDAYFGREFLLTTLMVYWVTRSATTSMRDYYDNRWTPSTAEYVHVPTAVAVFDHQLVPEGNPPREWAERLYDVRRWTVMPRGGHFAPVEEPELVAADIAAFFADLSDA